jgi:hypothetical protein
MNLGIALSRLGEGESGTAHLEEAVAAYRAALEERTRERVPLDWAQTQMNLGTTLSSLGERESGTRTSRCRSPSSRLRMNVESTLTVIAAAAAVIGSLEVAVPSCAPIRSVW